MPRNVRFETPKRHRYCRNLQEVATLLGMSRRTLQDWERDGIIQPTPAGKWSSKSILEIAESRNALQASDEPDQNQIDYWKARNLEVVCARKEFELQKLRESLVERSEVDRLNGEKIRVLREALLPLGGDLEPALMKCKRKGEMSRIFRARIEEIIEEFATSPDCGW